MKWIGRVIGFAAICTLISFADLLLYCYRASGEPMQVVEAQAAAPGMTFRQFWADRMGGWKAIDDRQEEEGEERTCVFVYTVTAPITILQSAIYAYGGIERGALYETISKKDVARGVVPPEGMFSSMSEYPQAFWWTLEQSFWFTMVHQFVPDCRLAGTPGRFIKTTSP